MKVAIVLSTYNGEKYIERQLDSLLNQRYKEFEVFISDDSSTDKTYEIIGRYINDNHISNWHLTRNTENAGWKKNFIRMLAMCDAEYIFPCDQDDFWHPEKLGTMVKVMDKHKNINLLACAYKAVYDDSEMNEYERENAIECDKVFINKVIAKRNLLKIDCPGCTYCVRGSFVKRIIPFWQSYMPHDALLWMFSFLEESLYILNYPLIGWRQHKNSVFGGKNVHSSDAERVAYIHNNRDYISFLLKCAFKEEADETNNSDRIELLKDYHRWMEYRYKLVIEHKLLYGVVLFGYISCYPTLLNYLGDLKTGLKKNNL